MPEEARRHIDGVREVRVHGTVAHLVVEGSTAPLVAGLAGHKIDDIVTHEADLEEVFLTYYGAEDGAAAADAKGV